MTALENAQAERDEALAALRDAEHALAWWERALYALKDERDEALDALREAQHELACAVTK